ncbi:RNA binding protein fox-1 homolog 1-like [Oncorhynchus kisutch]|uniref:RNA binding protein fox-1 homolog 1-like n=1 Tax=Oncorhynchus kisutch TaxID=8019 RepID=UPI0012DE046A|nr:RNA binding protein fox-1 homolog 1-like [Oncorhynchus kisutch]
MQALYAASAHRMQHPLTGGTCVAMPNVDMCPQLSCAALTFMYLQQGNQEAPPPPDSRTQPYPSAQFAPLRTACPLSSPPHTLTLRPQTTQDSPPSANTLSTCTPLHRTTVNRVDRTPAYRPSQPQPQYDISPSLQHLGYILLLAYCILLLYITILYNRWI